MSEPSKLTEILSPVSGLVELDQVCAEFEAAWKTESAPRLEDFLQRAPAPFGVNMLERLLAIEIDARMRAGELLKLDTFTQRFPAYAQQVETLFRRMVKPRRLGDYELEEELGRGGMGVVYRARQVFLNQTVALKVLPERCLDESQFVARFRREMQSIGALSHPNIVRAYNAGEADGKQFLVMEYVEGINLHRLVSERLAQNEGPLSVGAACEIIHQAALGLQHAHDHGLVHRDIKPANLMLTRDGMVKLLDLGLAKFHADRPPSTRSSELTQSGTTMGTVDYMAPEQWENSATVDIRADIYSLGCTLFFLLAGRAPYADKSYDSNRKKLMAHVVAPVPLVSEERSDCPEELDAILEQMMAKDPDGRFPTPLELADAIEPLADREDLALSAAAIGEWMQSGISVAPVRKEAEVATGKNLARASSERRTGRLSKRYVRAWYQQPRRVAGILLLIGLAAVFGWLAGRPLRDAGPKGTDFAPEASDVPPAASQRNKQKSAAEVQAAAALAEQRKQLEVDLALLPGLNGQWWFDEMPWYAPFLRQAMLDALRVAPDPAAVLGANLTAYYEPNVSQVQKWLWETSSRCRKPLTENQQWLLGELKSLADANLNDEELAGQLGERLAKWTAKQVGADLPAVDLHTRALLQHKAALLRGDAKLAGAARKSYDEALRAYAKAENPSPLRWLCQSDAARLCSGVLGDYKDAKSRYQEALAAAESSPLFRVESLVSYGNDSAAAGEYQDSLFTDAQHTIDASEAGKRSHPLAACIGEGYAWSLMDQWKVEEASRHFQEAYRIRTTNRQESKNPFAAIYIFHNRHGMAIALRYRGDPDNARSVFKALIGDRVLTGDKDRSGEIEQALEALASQTSLPGQQRYLRDLQERWYNSMERWADCELYGGAASGAAVNLSRARKLYREARTAAAAVEYGAGVSMACKYCLVAALQGDSAEARSVLDAIDAEGREILGPERERAGLLRQVAEAVILYKEKGLTEGQPALRHFLNQFKLNPAYTDISRRETLELQLFCAELLLHAELEAQDVSAAQKDLKYLDPLLSVFRGRKDMRPFLRRYYDLALRACDRGDLLQMAQYVVESRAVERQDKLRTDKVTLLLFSFAAKENFAIFLPQDSRPGKLIPLPFTRQQIKEAASHGQHLKLPDELVKMLAGEQQAGRTLDISWCDTMCYSSDDDGLSDAEWPFGEQFKPVAARKKP